jgi:hypothetical protein
MQKAIERAGIAAFFIFAAGATTGCSLENYLTFGQIRGGMEYAQDSVSVIERIDSRGAKVYSLDIERLAPLLEEPTAGSDEPLPRVEVITPNGAYMGSTMKTDTVLALKREPEDAEREGLLPFDSVAVTIRDSNLTQIRGTVRKLTERNLVLWVDGRERGYPLTILSAIRISDQRVISGSDLTSPQFSGNLFHVPGLVLGGGPSKFIPLRDVEKIRVSRQVVSYPLRVPVMIVGAVFDVMAIIYALSGGAF